MRERKGTSRREAQVPLKRRHGADTYIPSVLQGVFGARVKAYHAWQAAEANVRKLHSAHEKAKRSGRTHSELMNLSVAEIADVSTVSRLVPILSGRPSSAFSSVRTSTAGSRTDLDAECRPNARCTTPDTTLTTSRS